MRNDRFQPIAVRDDGKPLGDWHRMTPEAKAAYISGLKRECYRITERFGREYCGRR